MPNKIITINNQNHTPGYPTCISCPELIVGQGGYCGFKPATNECKYPEAWEEIVELEAGQVGQKASVITWLNKSRV